MKNLFKDLKNDLPASIVVFFVAVPLCLGIALASGAPLFAGIIAGIVGGIVVGKASGSPLGVSGPAAGLAVIVLSSIATLGGSWEAFLLAVVLAGVIQVILGYLKLGTIAYYFPSSVIKGMLTGIGLLIILKQIPHAFGYDTDFEGDVAFIQPDGQNTFSALFNTLNYITPGAVLVTVISLLILVFWDYVLMKKHKVFNLINGPLVAVFAGILLNYLFQNNLLPFSLGEKQIVQIPVASSIGEFFRQFTLPDLSAWKNPDVYIIAVVIAIVASLETLLCVEATDKLDPYKRITPTNRELKAQGIGNIISGLIGGLPLTQVIVRSSANITFGGKTKVSAILHGFFLLISAITIPALLNMIPLATLASILFVVGYKLAKPALFKQVYKQGWEQFVPFIATIVGILLTDLLKGIAIGMAVAIFYILRNNFRNPFYNTKEEKHPNHEHLIVLSEEVSFLNKGNILQMLNHIPANSKVIIDGTKSKSIHYDVIEIIQNFQIHAKTIGITLEVKGINLN
ncbi:MAG: SulP family inorganic anion transporter [Bacteroidetes bacterium]|nr:SulP family inorganic anion transporter [Bacteroidota bacterium]HET6243801.1 SulP family inorganic anion transporter [Bacteroidia bacterium]